MTKELKMVVGVALLAALALAGALGIFTFSGAQTVKVVGQQRHVTRSFSDYVRWHPAGTVMVTITS